MQRPQPDINVDGIEDSLREDRSRVLSATPGLRRELAGKLAGLSLPRQVLALAIWPLLEQVLNFGVGFCDTVLAGHLSVPAANALGVAVYVSWLVKLTYMAVGVGVTAVVARAIGGRHKAMANAALGQALLLAAALGSLVGATILLLAPWVGHLVHLDPQSLGLAVTYLRVEALSAPAAAVLLVGTASLRGGGDTRTPFLVMTVVNLINIAASVLLVYGPRPWGGYGVAGIAGGTSVAWLVGALLILWVLWAKKGVIRLRGHRLKPQRAMLLRLVRIGAPSMLESLGMWAGNFLVVRIVSLLPLTGALGAHMIAVRVEGMSYLPGAALGTAAATLTGQYLGLGDPQRARQAGLYCWAAGAILMTGFGLLFVAIPGPLVALVTDQPELRQAAAPLLRICGPVEAFFATYLVLAQALRGAGDTRMPMLLTYASTFLVRLPAAWWLGVVLGLGLWGVWLALCGELVLRAGLFAWRFLGGSWTKARV